MKKFKDVVDEAIMPPFFFYVLGAAITAPFLEGEHAVLAFVLTVVSFPIVLFFCLVILSILRFLTK